jgi:PIN domain nuclease of toxin-antitoxin system
MITESDRLSKKVKKILLDNSSTLLLSSVSSFEIAVKSRLGKLRVKGNLARIIPDHMKINNVETLELSHAHALATLTLPLIHKDPFDRLLISQARHERISILTPDEQIARYEIKTIW